MSDRLRTADCSVLVVAAAAANGDARIPTPPPAGVDGADAVGASVAARAVWLPASVLLPLPSAQLLTDQAAGQGVGLRSALGLQSGPCAGPVPRWVLVTERGQGDLRDWIEAQTAAGRGGGQPSAQTAAQVLRQVAVCLRRLHRAGVVHGDMRLRSVRRFGERWRLAGQRAPALVGFAELVGCRRVRCRQLVIPFSRAPL